MYLDFIKFISLYILLYLVNLLTKCKCLVTKCKCPFAMGLHNPTSLLLFPFIHSFIEKVCSVPSTIF